MGKRLRPYSRGAKCRFPRGIIYEDIYDMVKLPESGLTARLPAREDWYVAAALNERTETQAARRSVYPAACPAHGDGCSTCAVSKIGA